MPTKRSSPRTIPSKRRYSDDKELSPRLSKSPRNASSFETGISPVLSSLRVTAPGRNTSPPPLKLDQNQNEEEIRMHSLFKTWKEEVDLHLSVAKSPRSECLPDVGWRDMFDQGVRPQSATHVVLASFSHKGFTFNEEDEEDVHEQNDQATEKCFRSWKSDVEKKVLSLTGGYRTDELPDVDWRDMFDQGTLPGAAVRTALPILTCQDRREHFYKTTPRRNHRLCV